MLQAGVTPAGALARLELALEDDPAGGLGQRRPVAADLLGGHDEGLEAVGVAGEDTLGDEAPVLADARRDEAEQAALAGRRVEPEGVGARRYALAGHDQEPPVALGEDLGEAQGLAPAGRPHVDLRDR